MSKPNKKDNVKSNIESAIEETAQNGVAPCAEVRTSKVLIGADEDGKGGRTVLVIHTNPTFKALAEKLGEARVAKICVDYINRHNILKDVRAAYDVLENGSDAKTDEGKKKDVERSQALVDKVEAGETLDFWAFVPDAKIPPSRWEKFAAEVGKLARLAKAGNPVAAKQRQEMMDALKPEEKAEYADWCMTGGLK